MWRYDFEVASNKYVVSAHLITATAWTVEFGRIVDGKISYDAVGDFMSPIAVFAEAEKTLQKFICEVQPAEIHFGMAVEYSKFKLFHKIAERTKEFAVDAYMVVRLRK